jgi:hypothetical protein
VTPPIFASLLQAHAAWAWVVIMGNALAGVWALGAIWVPGLRTKALWWFTGFAQFAVFLEVVLGLGLVIGQQRQPNKFHPFYGFVAIVAVGFFFAYRDRLRQRLYVLYGVGGLFVSGLGIRALLVALKAH